MKRSVLEGTLRLNRKVTHAALYATLAAWGAISVARQLTRDGPTALRNMDPYGLYIPNYHFFCPEPASHDLNLLVRDKLDDGDVEPWREVVVTARRRLWHMLFYPGRRLDKGIMDISQELSRTAGMIDGMQALTVSPPYMSVLNMTTYGIEHDPRAVQTQFAFGQSAAYEPDVEPLFTFVSDFHDLPQAKAPVPVAA